MGLYYIVFKTYLQQSLFYHVTGFLRKKKKRKRKRKKQHQFMIDINVLKIMNLPEGSPN